MIKTLYIILDTGIALIVYGTPLLAIFLTILVSVIEAFYINRKIKKFSKTFKSAILANLASTVIGFVIIIWFNIADLFNRISTLIGHKHIGFIESLIILIFFYGVTLLIEIPIYKRRLDIRIKDVVLANLISYSLIAAIYLYPLIMAMIFFHV